MVTTIFRLVIDKFVADDWLATLRCMCEPVYIVTFIATIRDVVTISTNGKIGITSHKRKTIDEFVAVGAKTETSVFATY